MGNELRRLVSKSTVVKGEGKERQERGCRGGWKDFSGAYVVLFLSSAYKDVGVPSGG